MKQRILTLLIVSILTLTACGSNATPVPTPIPVSLQQINVSYDSSVAGWFQQAIQQFNDSAQKAANGKQLFVQGLQNGSGAIVESLVQTEKVPFDLIVVSDKAWIDTLAARRKQRGESTDAVGDCKPIARTPVVMITWRNMAEALGWPDREFTWHDVAELALSPSAWQGYDHPEWGSLTFGHAHPILSGGGLYATLGEAYAIAPLTLSDVQSDQAKSYLRVVERSVARYGSDSSSLIKAMADKGERYLHVAVGYESEVVANHKSDDGLIAIYPKETFVAEFTACVVNNNPDAAKFVDFLLKDGAQQGALSSGLRPVSTSIVLGAPIDASRGADPSIKFTQIPMPSVDVIRTVQDVWSQLKRPLNVTLVIDISSSMNSGGKMTAARTGAAAFINRLGDDDLVSIYAFSSSTTQLVKQSRIGENRSSILATIDNLRATGDTALYTAISQSRKDIKADSKRINALVVLTDGQDTASRSVSINDLLGQIRAAKGAVTIYTIGYGGDADSAVLARIADAGNGAYFGGDPATINQVYLEIASQFGGSQGLGR